MENITIIGLGYVGLPLAYQAASKNNHVIGVDLNKNLVELINSRKELKFLETYTKKLYDKFQIEVYTSIKDSKSNNYIICVPTPVKSKTLPDLSYIINACEEIVKFLKKDDIVVIESTIYPGVCEEIVKPILDKANVKYYLAHCPERINPGDKKWNVSNIPRVVGGIDKESGEKAKALYSQMIDAEITLLSQIKAAEATKILENTFRDINIAFINEMAQSFQLQGINTLEVIKGASTKPFAFMAHYPGAGVGGHCIAVDPYYMIEKGKDIGYDHQFLSLARRINANMPEYTVSLCTNGLNRIEKSIKNSRILVLGLSYKPDVNDIRESPAFPVINTLEKLGAKVIKIDPYIEEYWEDLDFEKEISNCDAAILITQHMIFNEYVHSFYKIPVFIDGRNAYSDRSDNFTNIYIGIGNGEKF